MGFISRDYTCLVRSYGLNQEFITPHCSQQYGMVERVIRMLKDRCVHRFRFGSQVHTLRITGNWVGFFNQQRPHQGLKTMTLGAACPATSTARPEQKPVSHDMTG
ncbi:integrase core domain-containing protein [Xanthomonas sp. 60]